MPSRFAMPLQFVLLPSITSATASSWNNHPEWAKAFSNRGVVGTALIYDEQADRYRVFDRKRAETRCSPASTFKVFNALVALDTGAVKDEYEVLRWNQGMTAPPGWSVPLRAVWTREQSLASAIKFLAVWFYQEMALRARHRVLHPAGGRFDPQRQSVLLRDPGFRVRFHWSARGVGVHLQSR